MSVGTSISADQQITFGPFLLLPGEQLLLESGKPVRLGSRALEILAALVERAGDLVSKDELIQRVWPNTIVEETNLKVHIAALRRALGDGRDGNRYVVNTPGRGYRFVAPVTIVEDPLRPAPAVTAAVDPRAAIMQDCAARLTHGCLLTLVGPGG